MRAGRELFAFMFAGVSYHGAHMYCCYQYYSCIVRAELGMLARSYPKNYLSVLCTCTHLNLNLYLNLYLYLGDLKAFCQASTLH